MQTEDNEAIDEPSGYESVVVDLSLIPNDADQGSADPIDGRNDGEEFAAQGDPDGRPTEVVGWGKTLKSVWKGAAGPSGDEQQFESREPFLLSLPDGAGGASRFFLPGLEPLQARIFRNNHSAELDTESELLAAKSVGVALYAAILPNHDALQYWRDRYRGARAVGRGVRLMLNLIDPELESVPWELLNDGGAHERSGGGFLALDPFISLVRRGEGGNEEVVARDPREFRVFLAHTGGTPLFEEGHPDQPMVKLPSWDKAEQQLGLHGSLSGTSRGERVSISGMLRDLRVSDRTTVFHFSGHGGPGGPQRGPYLLFAEEGYAGAGESVQAERLYADDLTEALTPSSHEGSERGRRGVELAVIVACHAGAGPWWSGFGARLLRAGVPAAVTMQAPAEDGAAEVFGAALYAALQQGKTVDAAVSAGRRAVAEKSTYKDWWLPLLHTHSDVRFAVPSGSAGANEEAPPPTLFRNGADGRPESLPPTGVGDRCAVLTADGRRCVEVWDGSVRVGRVDATGQVRDWTQYEAPLGLERLLAAKVNRRTIRLLAVLEGLTRSIIVDDGGAREPQALDPSAATSGADLDGGFIWVAGGRLCRTGLVVPRHLPGEGLVAVDAAVGAKTWLVAGVIRDEVILEWGRRGDQSTVARFGLDGPASAVVVVRPTDHDPEPLHVMVWHEGRWRCFDRRGRAVD